MASLFPIIAVLILAIYVSQSISVDEIIASASMIQNTSSSEASIWSQTPYAEIIGGVRAIFPLVVFLMFVLFIILRSKLPNNLVTTYGLALSIIGMCVFNIGLTYGLGAIGGQVWLDSPKQPFMEVSISEVSPIYNEVLGLTIVIAFAWLLGFGATLAENIECSWINSPRTNKWCV